jgi:uncharacterized RDD family membrane protein YckC
LAEDAMTAQISSYRLPDPDTRADFYRGVLFKRAVAWAIDVIVIVLFCLLILPFTAFTGIFFFPFLMLMTGFFYRWFTLSGRSSTWGMRMVAIEIRESDGLRLRNATAFWHTLGYTVSVAIVPLQLISVLLMLLSARRQGLSDHLLGTAAINRPI